MHIILNDIINIQATLIAMQIIFVPESMAPMQINLT